MSEFEAIDPKKLVEETSALRASKQEAEAVSSTRANENAENDRIAEAQNLAECEQRTKELFEKMREFDGFKIAGHLPLLVERPGTRPGAPGHSVHGEKPPWIVIRAASVGLSPRHRPERGMETVLAARCLGSPRYQLLIYPIHDQGNPYLLSYNDTAEFFQAIQQEIASR